MTKCAYCPNMAIGRDAFGMDACSVHLHYADEEFVRRTGNLPDDDTFEFCPEHGDFWMAGCERCETCSQYHYGCSIAKANAAGALDIQVTTFGNDGIETTESFHQSHGDEE